MKKDLTTLDQLFTYHPPIGTQAERYAEISKAAKEFARTVILNAPEGPDRDAAVSKIIEARMLANATIALNEKGHEAVKVVHLFKPQ